MNYGELSQKLHMQSTRQNVIDGVLMLNAVQESLNNLHQKVDQMSDANATAISGLTAAQATEGAEVSTILGYVQSEQAQIASLTAQLSTQQAPTQELLDAITAATNNAQSQTAAMAAALPPAPTPMPAPTPTPSS